ncbi:MAG TPA: hybrid sensor histidine kinase/response regulator [Nitrospirae bacterium]|nr:hybrid sensor histidine kinase/response regulator [Nitrospirota bacterium]
MHEKELLEFFLTEAEEHIVQLEKGFLELEQNPSDTTDINELFRTAHTLKGAASLVKLKTLSGIAHKMEDILESVRDSQLTVTKEIADWLLNSLDSIKFLVAETVNGRPEKVELLDEISNTLRHVLPEKAGKHIENREEIADSTTDEEATGINSETSPEKENAQFDKQQLEERRSLTRREEDLDTTSAFVKVHVDNLDKMMGLVGELTILKNFFISETEGANNLRNEIEYACKRLLKEIDEFDGRYANSTPGKMSFVDSLLEDFRELEFDRYDGIDLFANSIKEIMRDVNVAVKSISGFFDQFLTHTTRLDKLNMEFRDIISASRMVETGKLFQRFMRIVRDLSDQSGKQVRFIVRGSNTRIDRILYERLFTPLLHLVRNAFSHGIESPEDRRAGNKPEEGSIVLSARRDGNSVVIDIQDDGKGIDLKKVYQKAAKMGIIKNRENVSEARLHNILFMPGFSTNDEIDMTSGRGVGLDAVRQIISEINGTLGIASEEGKGTTFRITLPLTLIVVNTVKFRAGGLEFSVPSSLVHELMDISAEEYDREKNSIKLRDVETPVKDLCNLLKLNTERSGKKIPVIVFNLLSGRETALLVDEITGQEDTVIKPLGGFLEGLKCYSGFSISADARLSPVINPIGLLETRTEQVEILQEKEVKELKNNILIVDDSLSVRKFASMILEHNGYNVLAASNGLEALTVIDEDNVDLILTDLEMPVMHGYELLRELKRRGLLEVIPTVVLTSRSNEKHKEKARLLGAKDYIVKPFHEASLIETIRKHIKGGIIIPAE